MQISETKARKILLNDERLVQFAFSYVDEDGIEKEVKGCRVIPFTTKKGTTSYMLADKDYEPCLCVWEWDTENELKGYSYPCVTFTGHVFTVPYGFNE